MAKGKTSDDGSGKWKYINAMGLNTHTTKAKLRQPSAAWKPGDATPF